MSLMIEDDAPLQEKVVFVDVQFSGRFENLAAHLKGEEQLVHFEQAATRVPGGGEKTRVDKRREETNTQTERQRDRQANR